MSDLIIPGKTRQEAEKKELVLPRAYTRTDDGKYERQMVVPGHVAEEQQAEADAKALAEYERLWDKALCQHFGVKDPKKAREMYLEIFVQRVPFYPKQPQRPDADVCPSCGGFGRMPKFLDQALRRANRRFLWQLPCPVCKGARVV